MNARILDLDLPFTVAPAEGEIEPPRSITITLRPCWMKPPQRFELAYAYESKGVVYYHVVSRG